VYGDGAPSIDKALFELKDHQGKPLPILGICYGLQLIAHLLGGKVERAAAREFGAAKVRIDSTAGMFHRFTEGESIEVWMSHGDSIVSMPPGFATVGTSENTPFCAAANVERRIYGVQFHPEVAHTEAAVQAVRDRVGPTGRAICGLSGGVDSSVAAVLCHQALGDRLTCIFVDNGVLRLGEFEQVAATFRESYKIELVTVDARERFLGIMHAQATRMARLIDDLLSLSRVELSAHVRPDTSVDLVPIIRQVADGLEPLARERQVAIEIDLPETPVTIAGDREELLRLFENLIENALKYGASGGRVIVSLVQANSAEGAPEVRVLVRDFGPGIAPEHLPRLTERFYRVDVGDSRAQGGTGLGLSLVKHIVNRHRGRLLIESVPKNGATFTACFPQPKTPIPA